MITVMKVLANPRTVDERSLSREELHRIAQDVRRGVTKVIGSEGPMTAEKVVEMASAATQSAAKKR